MRKRLGVILNQVHEIRTVAFNGHIEVIWASPILLQELHVSPRRRHAGIGQPYPESRRFGCARAHCQKHITLSSGWIRLVIGEFHTSICRTTSMSSRFALIGENPKVGASAILGRCAIRHHFDVLRANRGSALSSPPGASSATRTKLACRFPGGPAPSSYGRVRHDPSRSRTDRVRSPAVLSCPL